MFQQVLVKINILLFSFPGMQVFFNVYLTINNIDTLSCFDNIFSSSNYGITWQDDKRLDTGDAPGVSNSFDPHSSIQHSSFS